jgi:uncharacterized membrane protein
MNLNEYRTVFIAGSMVLMLIAVLPPLGLITGLQVGTESYSEFWMVGPSHIAAGYPFNVNVNQAYQFFVGVKNKIGNSAYYMICFKFRNQTQPLPDVDTSEPSKLESLSEFRAFVMNGETREIPIAFKILEASLNNDTIMINRLSINEEVISVNSFAKWNYDYKGFYYELFSELWLYDMASKSFQFNNFVGIWINMTDFSV